MKEYLTQQQAQQNTEELLKSQLPKLRVAFLRNVIIEPIRPFIEYYFAKIGFDVDLHFADFDNILPIAMNTDSELYQFKPDLIILCVKLEYFAPDFVYSYQESRISKSEPDNAILPFVKNTLAAIRNNTDCPIIVHNFERPVNPSLGQLESQGIQSQLDHFNQLNKKLLEMKSQFSGVYIADVDLLQAKIGYYNFIDLRYWAIGKAPYTKQAYPELARCYSIITAAIKGKVKKCLVLDLDNTLWGGIVGEDGLEGIKIGNTFPGNCYQDFQKSLLDLYHRGIVLCLCSKNNEADALEVINNHPDMILRPKHFSAMRINWEDKASNIESISKELNIGLDSMVFIDDSDFEVNLVRERLPKVEVIQAPKDPTSLQSTILEYGFFDSLSFSNEDKERTKMYQQESRRVEFKSTAGNIADYLKSLEMNLEIKKADDFSIPRISQLTQRTNQFNLTTKRYSEDDIRSLVDSETSDVFSLALKDRFGDSGIVGVQIVKFDQNKTIIDSFMLSCRVLGRGVEDTFLYFSYLISKKKNHNSLVGSFVPTKKNSQVKDFYSKFGFETLNADSGLFEFDISKTFEKNMGHFKSVNMEGV